MLTKLSSDFQVDSRDWLEHTKKKKSVYLLFRLYENKYQENKNFLKNIGVIYELPLAFLAPAVDSVFFFYILHLLTYWHSQQQNLLSKKEKRIYAYVEQKEKNVIRSIRHY